MGTTAGILGISPPAYEQVTSSRRYLPRRHRRRVLEIAGLTLGIALLLHVESIFSWAATSTRGQEFLFKQDLAKCYASQERDQPQQLPSGKRKNPRWNSKAGQKVAVVLKNVTLFDGESSLVDAVDILFEAGLIFSVSKSSSSNSFPRDAEILDVKGGFVTPGLVDMHSHHLLIPFPKLAATTDVNDMPLFGPTTTFLRAIDGFKPYDPAIKIIASGGVTSSLVLPGSGNIIGGEAYVVKNQLLPGPNGEPVVEELLLDHGLPEASRRRYLKMACGENPKGQYHHTRMGLVWSLREHLDKARKVRDSQDAWCENALHVENAIFMKGSRISRFLKEDGRRPQVLELDTAIALLKGELNVNVHCYEPEDLERMLAVLHEFGVHPAAFHHALDAWKVPELLKQLERNVTIATFAENGFFKHEAYGSNLRGPKILDDHGVKVALKSDHTGEGNYAKYLMYQASVSHSFGLPEDKALQSVTSIPARSIQQHYRIGYIRPGYDADLVIWDVHPLQVGATPKQVFIDGNPILDTKTVFDAFTQAWTHREDAIKVPEIRTSISQGQREDICTKIHSSPNVLFTGIRKSLLDPSHSFPISNTDDTESLALLLHNNRIACISAPSSCLSLLPSNYHPSLLKVHVPGSYLTPGIIAFGNGLGLQNIPRESSTGDGISHGSAVSPQTSLHFAKYGIHFGGRGFERARIGGVTRAITAPSGSGFLQGVSLGLRTRENVTVLNDGIWKDEVALHVSIGQVAKGDDTPTISSQIEQLHQLLTSGSNLNDSSVYARAARGAIPLVVHAVNEDDISQLILLKTAFPTTNLVIYGGHASPLVASALATSNIPVILTGNRGAPDTWEKSGMPAGPPLSRSPASILNAAGVKLGLAVTGDSKIWGLAQEAGWAAKFAGLDERQAIKLVSDNILEILRLDGRSGVGHREDKRDEVGADGGKGMYGGDFVVWSGNPLRGEGSVVLSVQDDGKIADCWPDFEAAAL
ncbi:amidohydrolase-domain-containing protein [Bisporella sp. PMI_857]|nr:amidohydrolase-domain-containing protein [Bisporella sp. PMI_857]